MRGKLPDPWQSFLRDVDRTLSRPVTVRCLGGFVLLAMWELPRKTADVDFIEIDPSDANEELLAIAGEGSDLWKKYHLYFQRVSIAEYPEDYASRLIDITPRSFQRLHLLAFEIYDLVLAKLVRNFSRDREDVADLVKKGVLDQKLLEERFETELRPNLLNDAPHVLTMRLWLEEFFGAKRR